MLEERLKRQKEVEEDEAALKKMEEQEEEEVRSTSLFVTNCTLLRRASVLSVTTMTTSWSTVLLASLNVLEIIEKFSLTILLYN